MTAVTVLGTGIMGAGMARTLLREGHEVTVWNRSRDRAKPLADEGARVAEEPGDAVAAADVVITMLFDADSVADVMSPALERVRDGAVWLQASTVGVAGTDRLAALADAAGVAFLDAPVLGTKAPAENGRLVVLVSGPSSLRASVEPVLDTVGSRTQWVDEAPGGASRLKLVVNAWIGTVINGIAQSTALAEGLGLDTGALLEAVGGTAVDSPYLQLKGTAIAAGDFTPSFELDGVAKDMDLVLEALVLAGVDDTLARAVRDRVARASTLGHGAEDMAAVVHAYRPG